MVTIDGYYLLPILVLVQSVSLGQVPTMMGML
jgi:hypothetical protein